MPISPVPLMGCFTCPAMVLLGSRPPPAQGSSDHPAATGRGGSDERHRLCIRAVCAATAGRPSHPQDWAS